MSKGDVEMEDAKKVPYDSGNSVQESESKMCDAVVEKEGGQVLHAAAVSEDVNKSENDGGKLNECSNEDEHKTKVKTEVEDQNNPISETNEPIQRSVCEQISIKNENEELINQNPDAEEDAAPKTLVEKHDDAKVKVVEQNCNNGHQVREEKSTENDIKGGNHVNNEEQKPIEYVAEKEPKEIGKGIADYVEPVAEGEKTMEGAGAGNDPSQNRQLPTELSGDEAPQRQNAEVDEVLQGKCEEMEDEADLDKEKTIKDDEKEQGVETFLAGQETNANDKIVETAGKHDNGDSSPANQEAITPPSLVRYSPAKAGDHSGETVKTVFTQATLPLMGESDEGTAEDQAAFMKELESFYRGRAMDFKPPKFYGQPLNCLKLWRAVIRLGGYDRVTGYKLWRQVGESFHPPKTCTTVSWTFRIFYEKSLLEYERHKTESGELQLPVAMPPEASGVDIEGNGHQGSGSGRARRDSAARAMQGWHAQRLFGNGEVGEPIIKDKNLNNTAKREKSLKSIGSLKQKRPNEVEHSNKSVRAETSKQLVASVTDVGTPADWVKINIRQTKDCFEVYALVPGLLREEVRVQSDPAGRLVITGQPEQGDNPWGVTAFKKVVTLPARIIPLQTSAVVSLHGRLFVRVPFEQSNASV